MLGGDMGNTTYMHLLCAMLVSWLLLLMILLKYKNG